MRNMKAVDRDSTLCAQTVLFINEFFQDLLEYKDINSLQQMLHKNILWIGMGKQNAITDTKDFVDIMDLLRCETDFFNLPGHITNQSFQARRLNEEYISVIGMLTYLANDSLNPIADICVHFSGICKLEEGALFLSQAHLSIPSVLSEFSDHTSPEKHTGKNLLEILKEIAVMNDQKESFLLNQKRYEVALKSSGLTMFEYNIKTKDLLLYEDTAQMYGVPTKIENGVETFIKQEIIQPESVPVYKEMYKKILDGAPFANCYVVTKDISGVKHDFELSLTNVYDEKGNPIRAIGIRKNVSQILHLQKEEEFGKTLVHDKLYIMQADLTNDEILYCNETWKKEFNLNIKSSFSSIFKLIVPQTVFPADQEMVTQKLSISYIIDKFRQGVSMFSFSYRRKESPTEHVWYESTVSIIRDRTTNAINIRLYNSNINHLKEKELKAAKEQQLFKNVIASSELAYEVNITKNFAIYGAEHWNELYGIKTTECYSEMITAFSEYGVHPEDASLFKQTFCTKHVLYVYKQGEREISCQYRKCPKGGTYRWTLCTMRLFEDPDTNDIRGYSYSEDIDKQKRAELSLKYNAEHDALTKLYNKVTTENKIVEFLDTPDAAIHKHAFLMIDIDHFKLVNDMFGHLFGDAVLADIGEQIRYLFKSLAIFGRIGGDEFCVFLKNADSEAEILTLAQKLCSSIRHTYIQSEKNCTISASIGIAIQPLHGTTYKELFQSADQAMYLSKQNGRDRFSFPPSCSYNS